MSKHLLAIMGVAVLLCWPGDCPAQTEEPGPVRVGDRWSYDVRDGATGDLKASTTVVVIEINSKEINTRVSVRGRDRPNTVIHDLNWGLIDNGVWREQPSFGLIRTPLHVGKEWRGNGNVRNIQTGAAFSTSHVIKVVAQERVTTPAGAFDTFRIEHTLRQVNTKDQTKSSILTNVAWYAPAVNRWVKRTSENRFEGRLRDSTSEELTEYSRKP